MFRHIERLSLPAILATLMSLASCSKSSEHYPVEEGDGPMQAVFTVSMGSATASAVRSTPADGPYAPGEGLENYIDIPSVDYRCYLFDKNNVLVSPLTVVRIYSLGDEAARTYTVLAKLDDTQEVKDAMTKGCRFVFLANWGRYPEATVGVTTIADLCASPAALLAFTKDRSALSDEKLIPMYGVKEYNSGVPPYIAGEKKCDVGTFRLLRAFAKVEVTTSMQGFDPSSDAHVTGVELTRCNNLAFKAPAGVTEEKDYVTGSWFTDYTPVNIPAAAESFALPFNKIADNHYLVYIPEYRNIDSNGTPFAEDERTRIKVTFESDGNEDSGYVEFHYPADETAAESIRGKYFDIARNNWYSFDVAIHSRQITWTVDVQPYSLVELAPGFGIERDRDGNIIIRDANGKIIKVITASGEVITAQDFDFGDVSGSNLTKPDGTVVYRFFDDGRTQVFYSDGSWDIHDPENTILEMFTMNSDGKTGTWSRFDRWEVLVERYNNATLKSDLLSVVGGTPDVKFEGKYDGTKDVSYLEGGTWNKKVHLEVVYFPNSNLVANAINAPATQKFEQKDVTLPHSVAGVTTPQPAREVWIDGVLRYRYYDGMSYQILYPDGSFDSYDSDGNRVCSFVVADPNFSSTTDPSDVTSTYSRYDYWNHVIERWTKAKVNANKEAVTTNDNNKIIKYELVTPPPTDKRKAYFHIYYYIGNKWEKKYSINRYGEIV